MAITWAEVGLFKGAPPALQGNATLTRLGFTNVAATYNTTGIKKTSIAATIAPGDELWLAWGSQATTTYKVRGTLADELGSGLIQQISGRISTVSSPTAWAVSAVSLVPAWIIAQLTGVTDYFAGSSESPLVYQGPRILDAKDAAAVTADVTNTSYATYLGRAKVAATGIDILMKVTTQAA